MDLDHHNLTENSVPLIERIRLFNKIIEKYGVQDEHILSNILKVTPQVIIAFYELNVLDKEEIEFLNNKNLDMGIISTLMNIQPNIRQHIYPKLDEFLREKYPVYHIIEFINEGEWTYKIEKLYKEIKKRYWGEASSYLKDNSIESGTVNKGFRRMLVSIKTNNATKKQLQWLERAIIYDAEQNLGIFDAKTFQVRFPEAVGSIREFLNSKKKFLKIL